MPGETKDIRVYSHNVAKNYMYLDVLLETLYDDFNILFVQEPPWHTIRQAPSSTNKEGDDVTGAPTHPEWLYMVLPPDNNQAPRVMAFVSKRLARLCPSMRRDLVDHRDIFVLSLFQGNNTYNLMNVYSDNDNTAILYLWDYVDELPSWAVTLTFTQYSVDNFCHSGFCDQRGHKKIYHTWIGSRKGFHQQF